VDGDLTSSGGTDIHPGTLRCACAHRREAVAGLICELNNVSRSCGYRRGRPAARHYMSHSACRVSWRGCSRSSTTFALPYLLLEGRFRRGSDSTISRTTRDRHSAPRSVLLFRPSPFLYITLLLHPLVYFSCGATHLYCYYVWISSVLGHLSLRFVTHGSLVAVELRNAGERVHAHVGGVESGLAHVPSFPA
jgi:hypothetical protein